MAAYSDTPYDRGVRLLIVPGLHGSAADHWQTWLERAEPGSVRIELQDWGHADLDRWAAAIDESLQRHRAEAWVAVTHSFGCLALAHHAARGGRGFHGALMVAPADPARFGVDEGRLAQPLPFTSTLVVSRNDPWMSHADSLYFGQRWGCAIVEAGDAGHINPSTGYGPWLAARQWVAQHAERAAANLRPRQREAAPALGFAI
ncbi:RBBP9/YdeN family alpha/beta hydrolase [Ideonella sp. YS5]|uniref:RBBP9/YdeN family alpha/beta hydrolase n=1 Tax=Ideonella sp. YS5 TaxID=3453714 RepID=UPI003EEE56D5